MSISYSVRPSRAGCGRRAVPVPPFALLPAALACCGLALAPSAGATEGDPLSVTVGATVLHDSNLLRLPDAFTAQQTQAQFGRDKKSDTITVLTAGMRYRKQWSLQEIDVGARITDNRYSNFSQFDFTAKEYDGAWKWALTPHFTGALRVEQTEALTSFADYRSASGANVRTTRRASLLGDWWVGGGWHLIGGVSTRRIENSQSFQQQSASELTTPEIGLRYVFPSGTMMSVQHRSGSGSYPQRQVSASSDREFTRRETDFRLRWPVTGKSSLEAGLDLIEQRYPNVPLRNFSGTGGQLAYTWTGGKLQVSASARREIVEWQDLFASYYVVDSLSLSPRWLLGAKAAVQLSLSQSQRNYRGGAVVAAAPQRQDDIRSVRLGFDWVPTLYSTVNVWAQSDSRDSTPEPYTSQWQYDSRSLGVNLSVTF